jgi:hypothetical protein
MQIVDPQNYKTENAWFFKQSGLEALIQKRAVVKTIPDNKVERIVPPILRVPPSSSTVEVRVIDP